LVLYDPIMVVQVWDVSAGKRLRTFPVFQRMYGSDLAVDPTGSTAAIGGRETQSLRFFHLMRGKELVPGARPAGPPLDDFGKRVAALSAEEQVREVVPELVRRNPDFDGTHTRDVEQGKVIGLHLASSAVTDLTPVRALANLQKFTCVGASGHRGKLSDLTPLRGLPLRTLSVQGNPGVTDLTPLRGMPLESLHLGTGAART
jgi:hypothetical protein